MIRMSDVDADEAAVMLAQRWNAVLAEMYGGGLVSIDAVATACTTMFVGYISLIADPVDRATYFDKLVADMRLLIEKNAKPTN